MRRFPGFRALALAALVLAGAGWTASDLTGGPAAPREQPAPAAPGAPDPPAPPPAVGPVPAAGGTRALPPAVPLPAEAPAAPPPVRLTVEDIGVAGAPVVPVGVEPDGRMEIPGGDEVGWYRFGPRPGDGGSAVLAAHVAYDGADGVFRHLADLQPGATVAVDLADGTARTFVVTAVERHAKDDLPADVFARDGDAGLALVTCGGRFDDASRSYEDNVVVRARPT
ncbi:MAG TPA: class F sortase [Acidimicrobiales bacterium]